MNNSLFFETADNFEGFNERVENGIKYRKCMISEEDSIKLNIVKGDYFSIEGNRNELIEKLGRELKTHIDGHDKILLVAIGNPYMTSDSLGYETVRKVKLKKRATKFFPYVEALTNISSYDAVSGIVDATSSDCVICIDALTARSYNCIGKVYQLTDTGIAAGSGVGTINVPICFETLNVPVIALGVPTVVSAFNLLKGIDGVRFDDKADELAHLIVTPKNINSIISETSATLAEVIDKALE